MPLEAALMGHDPVDAPVQQGLRANWRQFALLVAVNAFVGGMVGLERTVLPLIAGEEFGISSKAAAVSFISSFGVAKAATNLLSGHLAGRFTRKSLLVAGWLLALPVPFLLIWAPSWEWIVASNLLLGANQGLAWSMTVSMKIDLVGQRQRGLALGLNEAAGYLAVAATAFATGLIANEYGLRPEPFYLGIGIASVGLALSVVFVRDTTSLAAREHEPNAHPAGIPLAHAFAEASWRNPNLWGASQAGFVNNLNDGLIWGIFPLFFASKGLGLERIAVLAAVYPLVWGALQILTGWVSDSIGRKPLIVFGLVLQAFGIWLVMSGATYFVWLSALCLVGIGTAMVYPTLLASISDEVPSLQRPTFIGIYRFWRDAGAIAGALLGGLLADAFGFSTAIQAVAIMTLGSGILAGFTLQRRRLDQPISSRR
jgi:MFS family permease